MSIEKECTLKEIQLIVTLFPRLECLTINLNEEDLESIARFLLSKANNNPPPRYLSSLCISEQLTNLMEPLRIFIESEKLLDDFMIKALNGKLYLWW